MAIKKHIRRNFYFHKVLFYTANEDIRFLISVLVPLEIGRVSAGLDKPHMYTRIHKIYMDIQISNVIKEASTFMKFSKFDCCSKKPQRRSQTQATPQSK